MGKIDLRQLKQYSSIIAKSQIDSARLASINRKSDDESIIRQQRLKTEIERTNAAHQRYINATVSGHKKINSNIGLTNKTLFSQQNLMTQLSQAAGIYFSVYQVGSFIRSLYTVSGEFEKQKVSLGAILQSTEQAGVLYERIKDLAVKSPFQFSELISYTKQLSAFSIPYNELFDTTKRLADVSAGLGVDMNRLVLAFGQVRSASVLRGQELRQFTEAGIPLVDELAKKFTKLTGEATSAGDVFDKISRRQVSFQMVKDIFTELTSEGGKFYKFQEIQAESLAGKLSNLKDSYQIMLSQIGEGNSGVMKDSVELLTSMMNNWESIARILKTLVVTYGTYRAVLITINALQKANVALTGAQRVLDLVNLVRASKGLTAATYSQVAAQRALNFAMSINPYVAIASVIAGLVGAIVLFSEKTKTAADIQNEFNQKLADEQQQIEQITSSAKGYVKTATDLSASYSSRKKALDELQKLMPEVFKNMSLEKLAALGLADAYNLVNKAVSGMTLGTARTDYYQATKEVLKAERELAEAESKTTGVKGSREAFQRLELAREAQRLAKKQYQDLLVTQKTQENIVKTTEQWRDAIEQVRKANPTITDIAAMDDEGYSEYINRIQGDYENLITANKKLVESNPFAKKEIDANKARIEAYKKVLNAIGGAIPQSGGSGEDPVYNRVKQQIDIIDKAKSSYEEYLKVVSGSEAARLVKEQTGIDFSTKSAEEQLKALDLSGMLSKNILATQNRIAELTIKYDKKSTVDSLKEALDSTIKFVNDNKDKYNLYNELFDITGNADLSKQLSFGNIDGKIGTYANYIKDEFNKLLNKHGYTGIDFDKLIGMSDEDVTKAIGKNDTLMTMFSNIKQAVNEQKVSTTKSMAQIISDYKTTEEKITTIHEKYNELRKKATESGQSQEFIDKSVSAYNQAEQKEVDDIMTTMYQLTPFYRELFGNLSDISYWHLKSIKDNAKNIINEIANTKGEDGKLKYGNYNKDSGKLEGYTYDFKDEDGKVQKVTISLTEYAKILKQISKVDSEMKSSSPWGELTKSFKQYKSEDGTDGKWLDVLLSKAEAFKSVTSELGSSVSGLFDAFGNDSAADAVGFATQLADSAANIATGIASGDPIKTIQGVIGGITSIAQYHDKKLQRAIERSKLEVQKLQNAYENLNKFIERQLGSTTTAQAKKQIDNLKKQQAELEKQRQAEIDKKKTDQSVVEDTSKAISDINDQIKYFYEDLFSEELGADLKDWSSQIASALVDAFSSGEDAAKAFDKTVGSIVKGLATKMIQLQFIEPAMNSIRDYLFGDKGVYNDAALSESDFAGLVSKMAGLGYSIEASKNAYDSITAAAKQAGIDLTESSSSASGITANVQSLTEDTGNRLYGVVNGSYGHLSAIRAMYEGNSQSVMSNIYNIMEAYYPNVVNQIAIGNAELIKINNNTLRSANNSDGILNAIDEVRTIFKRATTSGSGTKVNII
jgi:tape measure domain-containing protein